VTAHWVTLTAPRGAVPTTLRTIVLYPRNYHGSCLEGLYRTSVACSQPLPLYSVSLSAVPYLLIDVPCEIILHGLHYLLTSLSSSILSGNPKVHFRVHIELRSESYE
jgi:hypothetical protein